MKRVPRHMVARAKAESVNQFQPNKALEHAERRCLIDDARRDLFVAALTRLDFRLEGGDLAPERLVLERFQPFLHILPIVERSHDPIMPDGWALVQIWP